MNASRADARSPTVPSSVLVEAAFAFACFTLLALVITGPALIGRAALGPDSVLDWDPLYRTEPAPPLPPFNDFTPIVLHFPRDLAFARGLHEGRFDQWNPLVSAGAPLWAEQGGPFFPLKLPFYLAPSISTYNLFLALRLVFAALGAYFLARRRGLPPVAAITAGATFEVSGALIAHLPFGANSPVYMLPWVVLGSVAIAEDRTPRAAAGAALALGLAGHGGHPTMLLMVCSTFVVTTAALAASCWRTPRVMLTIVAYAALAGVLGMALAAPSLLPLAELASVGSSYKSRPAGAFVWNFELSRSRHLLPVALYVPSVFAGFRESLQSMLDFSPAIGLLGLVTAVGGMIGAIASGRVDIALTALGLYGIGLALAPPGLGWLHALPGLRFVLPNYAWPLVVLPVTLAVGRGVQVFSDRGSARLVLIAGAIVAVGASSLMLVTDVHPVLMPFGTIFREALADTGVAALLGPPAFAVAALAACVVLARTRHAQRSGPALAILIVGQQLMVMVPFTRLSPTRVVASSPSAAVQFLQDRLPTDWGRMMGVPYRVGHPFSPMLFALPDIRGVVPLPVRRYYDYLHAISSRAGSFTIQDVPVVKSPLLDLAGVRFVVLAAPAARKLHTPGAVFLAPPAVPAEDDPDMPVVYQDDRVVVYENRGALPRARIVRRAIPVRDEEAAAAWLRPAGGRRESAGALGIADTVVVEPDERGTAPPSLSGEVAATERVVVVDQADPDRLVLHAELERPGLVVIADTYYPGWRASVDGADTPIFPTDLLFRSVPVPAGEHTIELRYQPRSFRYGLLLFVLSAAICSALPRKGSSSAH